MADNKEANVRGGERLLFGDTVEKVVARRPNTTSEKFDLSDRPTNRSGASVKGKATHENRVRTTVTDFFNSILLASAINRRSSAPP
ncbi:hypothetical protein [Paraburkholderia elongata]|uniref:Uncharacterized protein n=1 Tax=Paraburkholderia elongata TaxID=2675747 RepID=A0A972P3B3_9BURK|nr:hypothetical protein [Paraburkholderia elongata]NPT62345.1 hypothetical protein [Paraburkholderia elongata]